MSRDTLKSRHALSNGLTLEFWDRSRPVAGDRWLVVLEARIVIPVTGPNLPSELRLRVAEIVAALGTEVVFSQKDERNFIAARDVAGVLSEMEARLLPLASHYWGHPDFSARFIRKKFAEHLKKQRCQQS